MRKMIEDQIESESLAMFMSGKVYDDGVIDRDRHHTVPAYGHGGGIGGQRDRRLNRETAGGDQLPLTIALKRTVTRIACRAVRHQYLKEAAALYRHIQLVAGLLQIALRVDAFGRHRTHPRTQLQA